VAVRSTDVPGVDETPAPVEKWNADEGSTDKPISLYVPPPSQIQMQCSPREIARCMKTCEEGDAAYCYAAAKAQENLPRASQNGEQILQAYTRACEGGFGAACVNIARMYFTGQHVEKSEATAFSMNKQACAKNDMYGCANAGLMAEKGVGTNRSMSVSHDYRTKACRLGHADSCAAVEAAEQRMKEADAAADWF
jgi:TPR repeat protein